MGRRKPLATWVQLEDRSLPSITLGQWLPPTTAVPEQPSHTLTEVVAGFRGGAALTRLHSFVDTFNLNDSKALFTGPDGITVTELRLWPHVAPEAALVRLRTLNDIAWAEPNVIVHRGEDFTPNDPQYSASGQYFHRIAQTDLAWDTQMGQPSIIVAVTDDGVGYNHPDLTDNIWINPGEIPGNGVDDDGNGFIDDVRGWDFSGNDNNPLPAGSSTHGTHVSGIIAARTHNATGVAGTAGGNGSAGSGVRIMPVRWAGTTSWTATAVANSFTYAANNGAKIVNSSYNFDGFAGNATVNAAFEYSYSKGVLHFNSAGNNSQLNPPRGVFTQPLFVASLDSGDVRSSFSNYGDFVDISGSGSSILSTTTSSDGTGVSYSNSSGTSMSTPHAAGVAALLWSQNPSWTREQLVAVLLGSADIVDAENPNFLNWLGTGRVNAYRGLTQPLPPPRLGRTINMDATGLPLPAPSSFTIFTPMRLDPASVTAANFELRGDGPDNTFDTADDVIVPLVINAGAAYQVGTNSLVFTKSGGGSFAADNYRFTAFSGATKLRDAFGTALDGDLDGLAGGNYVRNFTWLTANVNSISGRHFLDFNGNGLRDAATDVNLTNAPGTLYLDANNDGIRNTATTTFTSNVAVSIPAVGRVTSTITVSGMTAPIFDLDASINISHPRLSDLDIFLVSPHGTRIALATDVGGSGANFTNTRFSDEAATAITSGSAPFSGTFRPEVPLSNFDNQSANGVWTLEIVDDNPAPLAGTTKLNSWSLFVETVETSTSTDTAGNYTFTNLAAGNYTVRSLNPADHSPTAANKSYSVTLAAGGTSANNDFGFGRNGTVYGVVVNDLNANGTPDKTEPLLDGRTIFHDANNDGFFDTSGLVTIASANVPLTISDNTTINSTLAVSGVIGPLTDVNVKLNITHTYVGDLRLRLVGPTGVAVTLVDSHGGSGDNFTNTIFDDQAATLITSASAPFTGTFRPVSPLTAFNGLTPNGTWKLEITDLFSGDTGTLNSWSISITGGETSVVTASSGTFAMPLPAGSQTLRLLPQVGWRPTNPNDGAMTLAVSKTAPLTDQNFLIAADSLPPSVVSVQIGDGTPQRSRIASLEVSFSELVQFPGGPSSAFTLTGPNGVVPLSVSLIGSSATLTFAAGTDPGGSLPDGFYTLAINAANILDLAFNPLVPAAAVNFHRLFGDLDGNATVDGTDFSLFGTAFGSGSFAVDWDANGTIDGIDFSQFGARFGLTL